MNVRTRIGELARRQGIENAHQFQKRLGLSSSMASRLFNDKVEGLELQTIARLVEGLNLRDAGELFVCERGEG